MRIYVGNLPFSTTDSELATLFASYGKVTSSDVIRFRKSKRSKGYAFVVMEDLGGEKAVQALHKMSYQNRILKVREARDRANFPRSLSGEEGVPSNQAPPEQTEETAQTEKRAEQESPKTESPAEIGEEKKVDS